MKNIIRTIGAGFVVATIAVTSWIPLIGPTPQADASVTEWQKGVSIRPRWAEDFTSDSFKESVRAAKDMGASHITLVIPYYQSDDYSSDIWPGPNTPSIDTLGGGIDYIHSLNMKVVLKPHLEKYSGGWRGLIQASDRDAWYGRYGDILGQLADLGQTRDVEMIIIGTELIGMASYYRDHDNTQRWEQIIANLRSRYSGALTYSANWGHGSEYTNEFEHIGFWSSLDYIGISAYFEFHNDGSVQSMKDTWRTLDENQISKLQQKYSKPVLFTEVGYRSVTDGHIRPWDYEHGGEYDPDLQVRAVQALFEYWNERTYFAGIHMWDWNSDPHYGGQGNTDYTVRYKPAEEFVRTWFTRNATQPPTNQQGEWRASASTSENVELETTVSVPVTISYSGSISNVITDIEIYDSSNSRVFQQYYEGQNITEVSPATYNISWVPEQQGTYTLKTGVFSSGWASNLYWNDALTTIVVGNSHTPNPNPQPDPSLGQYNTNIWWPSDGASVSGTQPFKAMLEGLAIEDYVMYWQVDGDQLVEMFNSYEDYPHKEFVVDLSGWNWKESNTYTINFVSKNTSGETISEKSVDISVTN